MKKYKFLRNKNHFTAGTIHELPDVVATIYLELGVIELAETQNDAEENDTRATANKPQNRKRKAIP